MQQVLVDLRVLQVLQEQLVVQDLLDQVDLKAQQAAQDLQGQVDLQVLRGLLVQVAQRVLQDLVDLAVRPGLRDPLVLQEPCTPGRVLGRLRLYTQLTTVSKIMEVAMSVFRTILLVPTMMSLGLVQTGQITGTCW